MAKGSVIMFIFLQHFDSRLEAASTDYVSHLGNTCVRAASSRDITGSQHGPSDLPAYHAFLRRL
jgi:hypothetical protein